MYFGVVLTPGRRQNKIDTQIGKANAVLYKLYPNVFTKWELSTTSKFSVFKSVFVPILTYGHESWVWLGLLSHVQAAEMGFLRGVHSVTLRDKVHSFEIRVTPPNRNLSQCFDQVTIMPQEGLSRRVLLDTPTGKRPRGRPRNRWRDYIRVGLDPENQIC